MLIKDYLEACKLIAEKKSSSEESESSPEKKAEVYSKEEVKETLVTVKTKKSATRNQKALKLGTIKEESEDAIDL